MPSSGIGLSTQSTGSSWFPTRRAADLAFTEGLGRDIKSSDYIDEPAPISRNGLTRGASSALMVSKRKTPRFLLSRTSASSTIVRLATFHPRFTFRRTSSRLSKGADDPSPGAAVHPKRGLDLHLAILQPQRLEIADWVTDVRRHFRVCK